jgi:hypothetical protein
MALAEKDGVSTPEEATANAFADCLRILGLTPSGNDPRVLSLASKVIELAKEGEHNKARLRDAALFHWRALWSSYRLPNTRPPNNYE